MKVSADQKKLSLQGLQAGADSPPSLGQASLLKGPKRNIDMATMEDTEYRILAALLLVNLDFSGFRQNPTTK